MRPLALACLAVFVLTGCAKGLPNGGVDSLTQIHFEFSMQGPVDPSYIYAVAIRPLYTTSNLNDSLGPVPVVVAGSRNGLVAGRPTRLVVYDRSSPELYRNEAFSGPPSDPSDPDPGTESDASEPFNGLDPTALGGDPNTLGFDLTTQDLDADSDRAKQIVAIQFNILTANRLALNAGDISSRAFDALGDQASASTTTFGAYRTIMLGSGKYSNLPDGYGQPAAIPEGENDVANAPGNRFPPIDIVNYHIEVRTP